MTKKSLARQRRDAIKKELKKDPTTAALEDDGLEQAVEVVESFFNDNKSWDDLEQLYQQLARQLATNYSQLIELYKTPGLISFLEQSQYKETLILFKGIGKDFDALSKTLVAIHDRHKEYKGGTTDEAEFALSLEIFEAYENYSVRYDSIITPNFNIIVERAGFALEKINQAVQQERKKAEEQNVNVVTDVQVKDITKESTNE